MKTLIILLTVVFSSQAFAFTSAGFRAYSTATPVTCSYVNGLKADDSSFQVAGLGTLVLGTKGVASVTLSGKQDYQFICTKNSDGSAVVAKMFLGTEGTDYFPNSAFLLRYR